MILPKGTSFDPLTQNDINTVLSHVNSYSRPALNDILHERALRKCVWPERSGRVSAYPAFSPGTGVGAQKVS
jgi:hypothetical protein